MLEVKLADLKHINEGLHKGRVGSRNCATGAMVIDCTSINKTYADALNRVLSTITKICDAQKQYVSANCS